MYKIEGIFCYLFEESELFQTFLVDYNKAKMQHNSIQILSIFHCISVALELCVCSSELYFMKVESVMKKLNKQKMFFSVKSEIIYFLSEMVLALNFV